MKYHINRATGRVGQCRAKFHCPHGSLRTDHYASREEARIAYENEMNSDNLLTMTKREGLPMLRKRLRDTTKQINRLSQEMREAKKRAEELFMAHEMEAAATCRDEAEQLASLLAKAKLQQRRVQREMAKKAPHYAFED